jgi:phosphoribosylanthranilate isomerase
MPRLDQSRAAEIGQRGAAIVHVKICGVTNWRDARLAVDLGVHALGFNFYPASPRSISPAEAWAIVRKLPPLVATVGVFVDWSAEAITALAGALRLDGVQLHGDEPPSEAAELAGRFGVIKAFGARPEFKLPTLAKYKAASAFLLDGYRSGFYGGTGQVGDWQIARQAKHYGRVILAGGLRPGNVAQAISEAQPYGIDVASGVESRPGVKDPAALRELMREVEAASSTVAGDVQSRRNGATAQVSTMEKMR